MDLTCVFLDISIQYALGVRIKVDVEEKTKSCCDHMLVVMCISAPLKSSLKPFESNKVREEGKRAEEAW